MRSKAKSVRSDGAAGKSGAKIDGARWNERVQDHRRRQASVTAILDETFGRFAESDPSLWDRRVYLMLVGIVYERLAIAEEGVSTDELIMLAKLLAESRRANTQARDRDSVKHSVNEGSGEGSHDGHSGEQTLTRKSRKKASKRGNASAAHTESAESNNGRLPDAFGDVVRQIYGTTLPDRESVHARAPSNEPTRTGSCTPTPTRAEPSEDAAAPESKDSA